MKTKFEHEMLAVLKKNILLILIISLACGVFAAVFKKTSTQTTYSVKSTVLITPSKGYKDGSTYNDIRKNQNLVGLYNKLAGSTLVLSDVINKTGYTDLTTRQLEGMITIKGDTTTQSLDIEVKNTDKNKAYNIAVAEQNSLIEKGAEVRGENQLVAINIPQRPEDVVKEPVNKKLYFIVGAIAGFILSWLGFYLKKTYSKK